MGEPVRSTVDPHSAPAPHHHHDKDHSDAVGQVLSVVCAVHCVATPLVLTLLPAAASALGGAHPVLFAFVVVVGAWAFVPGYRCHRRLQVPALAVAGAGMLGLAAFVLHETAADTVLSLVGASLMMAAHWRNRVLLKAERCCDKHRHAPHDDHPTATVHP
jgi:hypothetical protein